jgi:predicted phosphodiesterase
MSSAVASEHREQLWKTFNHIIDICRKEETDILLIPGDLFEAAYVKISDVKRIADSLASIPKTRVFISPGNHDPINETSYYNIIAFPSNTHIFKAIYESVEITEHNCVVYGFGWDKNRYDTMPFAFSAIDKSKVNILCLHCDTVNQTTDYLPIKDELISSLEFDYVALGHIHKATQVKNNMFYSGSPEPLNFGEEGRHGYVNGLFEGKSLTLSFTHSNKREFLTLQIKIDAEMDSNAIKKAIISGCGEGLDKNIYRIVFTGIAHPHISIDNVMADIKDDFYSVDYYDRTVPDYDIKKIYQDNKENIIGKFIYSLTQDATKDPIAYKALLSGLEALLYRQEANNL